MKRIFFAIKNVDLDKSCLSLARSNTKCSVKQLRVVQLNLYNSENKLNPHKTVKNLCLVFYNNC